MRTLNAAKLVLWMSLLGGATANASRVTPGNILVTEDNAFFEYMVFVDAEEQRTAMPGGYHRAFLRPVE